MSDDEGFRRDLRGLARRNFSQSVRARDFMTDRERSRATQIAKVERRVASVREKAREHFQTMKPVWVNKERARLARKNPDKLAPSRKDGPRPNGVPSNRQQGRRDGLTAKAEANVKERCQKRLRHLEKIEHRMVRAATRNRNRNR